MKKIFYLLIVIVSINFPFSAIGQTSGPDYSDVYRTAKKIGVEIHITPSRIATIRYAPTGSKVKSCTEIVYDINNISVTSDKIELRTQSGRNVFLSKENGAVDDIRPYNGKNLYGGSQPNPMLPRHAAHRNTAGTLHGGGNPPPVKLPPMSGMSGTCYPKHSGN